MQGQLPPWHQFHPLFPSWHSPFPLLPSSLSTIVIFQLFVGIISVPNIHPQGLLFVCYSGGPLPLIIHHHHPSSLFPSFLSPTTQKSNLDKENATHPHWVLQFPPLF
jgi:hypothetical protein